MNTSGNLDRAFQQFEQEMQKEATLLNQKKADLKHVEDEIVAFTEENRKQKLEIGIRERKIREDESKKRQLVQEIRSLELKQREDQVELAQMANANKERLTSHGVKIPPSTH